MTDDLSLALGPLSRLLDDPAVTDVLVNGADGVWVDRGSGAERSDLELSDEATARRLAVRLAALAGRRLDDSSPWVDGLLPGGVRMHAVLPPLVASGAHLSLRVPRVGARTLAELRQRGLVDERGLEVLGAVVASRVSFVISGGTGTGKTTLLAAMLAAAPAADRLLVVEDVRELSVQHPHVVYLQGRAANVEGRGEVTMTTLVRQSLRMRPDRLVVGEVRGPEVRELLTALNTGHEGGCGTVHANAGGDVVPRFEALGALAGLSPAAVHAQLASAIEVALHLGRDVGGGRHLEEIGVLVRGPDGRAQVETALSGGPGKWRRGPGWERLARRLGLGGRATDG